MQQIRLNQPIIVGLDTSGQPSYVRALVARIVRLTDISEATGATIVIQVGYASKLDPAMEVAAFFGLSEYPVTFAPGPDLDALLAAVHSLADVFTAILSVLAAGTVAAAQLTGTVETVAP